MREINEVVIEEDILFGVIRNFNSSFGQSRDCKIRIVQPHDMPQENTNSFTPRIISIGPLHHGTPELQPMENFKHKLINDLLNRRSEYDLNPSPSSDGRNDELLRRFIRAAREMEERARNCYVLSNIISSDDFVMMLVKDGCFLLEFLIKDSFSFAWNDVGWQLPLIKHDILLFENQIPFFVLEKFHEILKNFCSITRTMMKIAYDILVKTRTFLSNYDASIYKTNSALGTSNLLHLYHMLLFNAEHRLPSINLIRKFFSWLCVIISYPMFLIHLLFAEQLYPISATSAMELEEAGIRFQGSYMGLRLKHGSFFIPVLTLDDQNLCLLKNLLAFEFYYRDMVDPVVHMYVALLFHLIKNPEDLKVMEKHHIIITSRGGEESFKLISDLLESGFENLESLVYRENGMGWPKLPDIREQLEKYCKKSHHRWRAMLMKDYFGNPWSMLGIFVGVLFLDLATVQTVFTVLSYYYHPQSRH